VTLLGFALLAKDARFFGGGGDEAAGGGVASPSLAAFSAARDAPPSASASAPASRVRASGAAALPLAAVSAAAPEPVVVPPPDTAAAAPPPPPPPRRSRAPPPPLLPPSPSPPSPPPAAAPAVHAATTSGGGGDDDGPRPRIYVYDLPERLRMPCHWPLTCVLHEAIAASPHRTRDPLAADYFWIPHKMPVLNDGELREILRIVTHDHPWFNDTVAAGVARTIMVFSCDHGPAPCTWSQDPCSHEAGLREWAAAVNPAHGSRALMFLGPGGVRDGADAGGPCCAGCFQRGKDVVLPAMTPGRDWDPHVGVASSLSPWLGSAPEADAFVASGAPRAGAPRRNVTLWFAGAAVETSGQPGGDATGRAAPLAALRGQPGMELLNTANSAAGDKSTTFEAWAPLSVFCLDPMGTHGGWAARVTPALYYGCIPLDTRPADVARIFDEHPEVLWPDFAVQVPAPLGAAYAERLRSALAEAGAPGPLRARRAAARAVYRRFLWTRARGHSLAGEPHGDGGPDALSTLMDILAARLDLHKGVPDMYRR
jgi:hypothetical protein